MKKGLLAMLLVFGSFFSMNAQSPVYLVSGDYNPPNSWTQSSGQLMGTVVNTNIQTSSLSVASTGNKYFRFYSATSGGSIYGPSGTSDVQITSGAVPVTSQTWNATNNKAYYLTIANANSNIVFKTNSGAPGTAKIWATEVQGAIRTVSGTTQSPTTSAGVYANQSVTVSTTVSGALSTGQAVYLRYSTNSFSTSTVVAMTLLSGTTYTATIPAQTGGTTVSYYVLTSGSTTPTSGNEDLMTINVDNNSGANYSYTVNSGNIYYYVGGTTPSVGLQDRSLWSTISVGGAAIGTSGTTYTETSSDIMVFDGTNVGGGATGAVTLLMPSSTTTHTYGQWIFRNNVTVSLGGTSGRTYNIGGGLAGNDLDIQSGSSLSLTGSSTTNITVTTSNTGNIAGTFDMGGATGNVITATGTVTVANGGKYRASSTAGTITISTLTWAVGSTCEITGFTGSTGIAGLAQNFYNLKWNCASQTSSVDISSVMPTIQTGGTFEIAATNTGSVILNNGGLAAAATLNINGDLKISGGTLDFCAGSGTTKVTTINLAGNFIMTGGTFTTSGASASANTWNFTGASSTFTQSGGTFTMSKVNIAINSGASLTLQNNLNTGATNTRTFSINGTLNTNGFIINGSAQFFLNSGGTLYVTDANGITTGTGASGSIQTTSSSSPARTYNVGANYVYSGSAASAVTGNGFTGGVNLTISNTNGVQLTAATNPTITGTLTLSGNLDLNANNLTLNHATANAISLTGARSITSTGAGTLTVSTSNCTISGSSTPSLTLGSTVTLVTSKGVDFGSNLTTINGTFQINSGGFASTNAPIYGNGSILNYNSGTTYGRGTEWSTTSGAGYPYNVSITGNTTLDMGANSGTAVARTAAGNLTIASGSTFSMNTTAMSVAVTINGNVSNSGTIVLSATSGGDFKIGGNFTQNGTFTHNNRAIFFTGSSTTQTIAASSSPVTIPYIVFSGTSNTVQLNNTSINITAPNGGNAIDFGSSSNTFDLNTFNATLGTAGQTCNLANAGSFKGNTSSSIIINGTTQTGNLNFVSPQQLSALTLNLSAGSATLGSALSVGTLTFTAGKLILGANDLTVTSSVSGATSSNYVVTNSTGALRQTVGSSTVTYPIGSSASLYNPITLNNTGGTSDTYKIRVASGTPANVASPTTDYVKNTWTITEGTAGGSNLAITTQWAGSDEGSTFTRSANVSTGYYNGTGTSWTTKSVTVSGIDPYTTSATSAFTPSDLTAGVSFVTGNFAVLAPTVQASGISFTSLTSTSMTINWTRGDGVGVAVFVKNGSGSITNPTNGTSYTANTTFGSGTQLGSSGYYCVLNGTSTSVTVTGLTQGSTYYVQAFEYNGSGALIKYLTTTATNNPNNRLLALVPTVTTGSASSVSTTSVALNGTVSANGATTTNSFDYGTTTGYGTNVSATPSTTSSQSTSLSTSLTGLTANTLYNFRASANNSEGTTNGSNVTFTTVSLDPTIGSTENSNAQTSANTNGFTAYWAAPATQGNATFTYTLDYSTDNTFSSGVLTVNNINSANLSYTINSLTSGTTYYYRVKAVNAGGSSNYAASTGITTTSTPDIDVANSTTVSAGNISIAANNNILASISLSVTTANATLTGFSFPFTNSGLTSSDIANYKIYYTTSNTFSTSNLLATVTSGVATTPIAFTGFSQTITLGNTGYFWITADVANSATAGRNITASALTTGNFTFSGAVNINNNTTSTQGTQTITTLATVTTTAASSITGTTASSGGNVTLDGSSSITERGIVYSTSTNPTTADTKVIDGATTTGTFSSNLTGLSLGTTYYVRAYVINGVGTAYGNNVSFTTLNIPTVSSTTAATNITGNSASSGGNVTSNGGDAITERGIVYSTNTNPTIADTKVVDAAINTGTFTSNLTGLSPTTTYYIRAYATNSTGTAYGPQVSFSTISSEPTAQSTISFTAVTYTTATLNFPTPNSGGGTSRIVLMKASSAVSSDPVDATSYTDNAVFGTGSQIGTGNYVVYNGSGNSVTVTGLAAGVTYYVAVYEYNGSGGTANYLLPGGTASGTTTPYDYRSLTSGNWNSASTWQYFDGTNWVNSTTTTPSSTDGNIYIRSGHTITVTASVSIDQVSDTGTIIVNSGATLTIADGAGTDLSLIGSTSYLKNIGTVSTSAGATSTVFGTYEHAKNGGTILAATWNTGSTCLVTGVTSTTPSANTSQNFYNFTWNCTGQSGNISLAFNNNSIAGDFTVTSVGTPTTNALRFTTAGTAVTNNISIAGNVVVNAGLLTTQGSSSGTTTINVSVGGNITIASGATLDLNNGNGTSSGAISIWTVTGNITNNGTIVTNSNAGSTASYLTFTNAAHTFTNSGTITTSTIIVPASSSASLDMGSTSINGTASFTLGSGATLTSAAATIISATGTTTLSTSANYVFNGASAQTLPATLTGANNITVTNGGGIILGASTAVTGTLTLTNGKVTLGANTLTLTNAISGASSSNYIITSGAGLLKRLAAGISGATLFPVGNSSTSYTPITLTNTGTSQDLSVASSATITNAVNISARVVTLQWTVTPGGAGAVLNASFTWNTANNGASFSNTSAADLGVYTTGPYTIYSLGTLSGNTASYTGLSLANSANIMVIGNTNAVYAPVIAGWDFNGQSSPATFAATTFNAKFDATSSASNITRGAGAASSSASNSFRTTGFQNDGISTSNTDYFQVTLKPATGYKTSLATITANFAGTSTFYASPGVTWQYAYSLDGTNFTLIGSPSTSLSTSLTNQVVDVSGVSALQNVAAGTTIYIRYYASGQTTTGGWGFTSASAGTNGLAFTGSFDCVTPSAPTAVNNTVTYNGSAQTASATVSTGYTVDWYAAASGGTALSTGTTTSPSQTDAGTYTYYAEARNNTGSCTYVSTSRTAVSLTINQKGLTVSGITANNKPYDGNANATINYGSASLVGIVSGDNGNVTLNGTNYNATFNNATVGTGKAVTASNFTLSGTRAANYSLTQPTGITANITPITLTVTANNQTVCFGTSASTVTGNGSVASITGYVNGENSSVISGSVTSYTTNYTNTTAAGTSGVTVTPVVTGLTATNYVFSASNGMVNIDATTVAGTASVGTTPICTGSTTSTSLSGNTGSVQWQESANGTTGWANVSGGSGATTTNYTTAALTANNYYRAVVTNGTCASANSNTVLVTINPNGTWTGAANNGNYNDSSNWCGSAPTSGQNLTISSTAGNFPTLASNISYGNVTIPTGTSLGLGGYTLTVTGTLSGSGVITGSPTSSLILNGASVSNSLNMDQTSASTASLNNLSVSGTGSTTTLGAALNLYGNLKVSAGTLNLNSKLVTLKSTATNDASVDNITGSLTGATNVTVERYKQNRRAWVLITAPLSANNATTGYTQNNGNGQMGSIKDNWQNYTYITGSNGNGTTGGLDQGAGNNWGILSWSGTNWANITNTTNANSLFGNVGGSTADNKHFFLFVRGDRSIVPTSALNTSSVATLAANGSLQIGAKTLAIAAVVFH